MIDIHNCDETYSQTMNHSSIIWSITYPLIFHSTLIQATSSTIPFFSGDLVRTNVKPPPRLLLARRTSYFEEEVGIFATDLSFRPFSSKSTSW